MRLAMPRNNSVTHIHRMEGVIIQILCYIHTGWKYIFTHNYTSEYGHGAIKILSTTLVIIKYCIMTVASHPDIIYMKSLHTWKVYTIIVVSSPHAKCRHRIKEKSHVSYLVSSL